MYSPVIRVSWLKIDFFFVCDKFKIMDRTSDQKYIFCSKNTYIPAFILYLLMYIHMKLRL